MGNYISRSDVDNWAADKFDAEKDEIIAQIEENVERLCRDIWYRKQKQRVLKDGKGTPFLTGFSYDLLDVHQVKIGATALHQYIGTATFTGSGLDDMTSGGAFTGGEPNDVRVQVDAVNTVKSIASAPTAGGTGYAANDVLTITTGDGNATVKVLTVDGNGKVLTLDTTPVAEGSGYATGAGQATSGGTGSGCTVDVTALEDTVKVSYDEGVSWHTTGLAVTGSAQTIEHNIIITFGAATGHTVGDRWDFDCHQDVRFDKRSLSLRPVDETEFPQVAPAEYTAFPKGYRNIELIVDTGWASVPAGIKRAIVVLVEHRNEPSSHRKAAFKSEKIGDYSYTVSEDREQRTVTGVIEADDLLRPFVRRRVRGGVV